MSYFVCSNSYRVIRPDSLETTVTVLIVDLHCSLSPWQTLAKPTWGAKGFICITVNHWGAQGRTLETEVETTECCWSAGSFWLAQWPSLYNAGMAPPTVDWALLHQLQLRKYIWSPPSALTLMVFPLPLPNRSLSLKWRGLIKDIPFKAKNLRGFGGGKRI